MGRHNRRGTVGEFVAGVRAGRDLALCEQHLGPARALGGRCDGVGCDLRPTYAFRVTDGGERVRHLCTRHSARRLRHLATVPRPSLRQKAACRLARLSTRQFLELSGEATAFWYRQAEAELAEATVALIQKAAKDELIGGAR